MKNIILIGFMGVGKGSVAREMVKQADIVAIDTDDIIESMENRTIKKIFATEGEKYFRDIEAKVAKWLEKSVEDTLISTGGGFYKVKNLKKIGTVVFLDSPFDKIYERIINHPKAQNKIKKRPLFQDLEKARELYEQRYPQYQKAADITIDVTDKSVEKIVKEILRKVKL
ncbi:shikimate kinase [Sulfurimonas sp. HSL-1716]|uniref:shikimate kinase n=1 Tax=Hydrocurvibacter sulfurireducens TaxID=3131937 RepID=UPI0031F8E1E4